jgi:hypothetical protein
MLVFFEIYISLDSNYLVFQKNRTSKLVHSGFGFFNTPKGCGYRSKS